MCCVTARKDHLVIPLFQLDPGVNSGLNSLVLSQCLSSVCSLYLTFVQDPFLRKSFVLSLLNSTGSITWERNVGTVQKFLTVLQAIKLLTPTESDNKRYCKHTVTKQYP